MVFVSCDAKSKTYNWIACYPPKGHIGSVTSKWFHFELVCYNKSVKMIVYVWQKSDIIHNNNVIVKKQGPGGKLHAWEWDMRELFWQKNCEVAIFSTV